MFQTNMRAMLGEIWGQS